jgi:phosphate/sulfate permease
METYFLIFVVLLFILAISDLVVGVSNDAVNFLNSSIGSKVAPIRVIMIVAALGVLIGATFSSGMMEVARKGIFHPDQFYFNEIMVLFLAVMITDIMLLDLFNTYGLPTSTTVSIVFELLGAAVAISFIKIMGADGSAGNLATYINSSSALAIISGILLSVIIAFTVGAVIQYISRIIFSFNYKKSFKYFGAIWGGIAITAITYFILIKGLKGSAFADTELASGETISDWVKHHAILIIFISFVGWTVIMQVLSMLTRFNILRFIVLVGTFAIAMAFAGNDLVNFIGVPLAGYESYMDLIATGQDPNLLVMDSLKGQIQTPPFFLVIAGLIMVITLWTSRKAKSVTETEINLARQDAGAERFESTGIARAIVGMFVAVGNGIRKMSSPRVQSWVNSRFERTKYEAKKQEKGIKFDLIRASVNLTVASILIAFATSLRLPLSTTYVTFMVAMGTSLADRAWGRESAVYRITGVVTVITGWFFTAMIAFTAAFIIAFIIYYGKMVAVVLLVFLAGIFVYRTRIIHKKRVMENQRKEAMHEDEKVIDIENVFTTCRDNVIESIELTANYYNKSIEALIEENFKKIKKVKKGINKFNNDTKELKDNIHRTIHRLEEDSIESGHYYVQVLDYVRELAHCINFVCEPIYQHLDNHHPPLTEAQIKDLLVVKESITDLLHSVEAIIKSGQFDKLKEAIEKQQESLDMIQKLSKKLIKSLKKENLSTKSSLLYMELLAESKNLLLYSINLLKSQRDFVIYRDQNGKDRLEGW